jgi:hypothetical protein
MQKSVRASCIIAQNPDFDSIGILVVAIATRMSMSSGIEARRVTQPHNQQCSADDFHDSYERTGELGCWNTDLCESSYTQSGRKQEFLNALR